MDSSFTAFLESSNRLLNNAALVRRILQNNGNKFPDSKQGKKIVLRMSGMAMEDLIETGLLSTNSNVKLADMEAVLSKYKTAADLDIATDRNSITLDIIETVCAGNLPDLNVLHRYQNVLFDDGKLRVISKELIKKVSEEKIQCADLGVGCARSLGIILIEHGGDIASQINLVVLFQYWHKIGDTCSAMIRWSCDAQTAFRCFINLIAADMEETVRFVGIMKLTHPAVAKLLIDIWHPSENAISHVRTATFKMLMEEVETSKDVSSQSSWINSLSNWINMSEIMLGPNNGKTDSGCVIDDDDMWRISGLKIKVIRTGFEIQSAYYVLQSHADQLAECWIPLLGILSDVMFVRNCLMSSATNAGKTSKIIQWLCEGNLKYLDSILCILKLFVPTLADSMVHMLGWRQVRIERMVAKGIRCLAEKFYYVDLCRDDRKIINALCMWPTPICMRDRMTDICQGMQNIIDQRRLKMEFDEKEIGVFHHNDHYMPKLEMVDGDLEKFWKAVSVRRTSFPLDVMIILPVIPKPLREKLARSMKTADKFETMKHFLAGMATMNPKLQLVVIGMMKMICNRSVCDAAERCELSVGTIGCIKHDTLEWMKFKAERQFDRYTWVEQLSHWPAPVYMELSNQDLGKVRTLLSALSVM